MQKETKCKGEPTRERKGGGVLFHCKRDRVREMKSGEKTYTGRAPGREASRADATSAKRKGRVE